MTLNTDPADGLQGGGARRSPIEIPVETIDRDTGKPVDSDARMWLLPAAPGKCEVCATAHEPELPHNAQSLFYQMRFQLENGRSPSWIDAMAHCDEVTRAHWTHELNAAGVDVAGGAVNPKGRRK